MTEDQWRDCTSPEAMLNALTDRASARKLRLYAIGCCRRIGWLLRDLRCSHAVDVAQRFADRLASLDELAAAERTMATAAQLFGEVGSPTTRSHGGAAGAAWATTRPSAWHAAWDAAYFARQAARETLPSTDYERERRWQAELLHDLFGNPFRPCTLEPYWLAHAGGTAAKLARVIYDEDRYEDLPILADALEEAGCDRVELLHHCRAGREHNRGCWVVDLVLGVTGHDPNEPEA